jgi:hypothetical protein
MRLVGVRDLSFSAKPTEDSNRVAIRIGPCRFSASRGEAIQLAAEIVAAVDALPAPTEGKPA